MRTIAIALLLSLTVGSPQAAAPELPKMPEASPEVLLPIVKVRADAEVKIMLDAALPPGTRLHPTAPFRYRIFETRGLITVDSTKRKGELKASKLPVAIPFRAPAGKCQVLMLVQLYYCPKNGAGSCTAKALIYGLPFEAMPEEKTRKVPLTVKAD